MSAQTPAGWYDDPEGRDEYRWWDGERWTEHRAPRPAPGHQVADTRPKAGTALIAGGYIAAILLPIVGLILGAILLARRALGHGLAVVAISVAVGAAGFLLLPSDDGKDRRDRSPETSRPTEGPDDRPSRR